MLKGLDATANLSHAVQGLTAQGYGYVGRYYTRLRNWKVLTRREAETLCRAGLKVFSVYQDANNAAHLFSQPVGYAAGREAYRYAFDVIGQPAGSSIYFAVDFDASPAEIAANVIPYFEGLAAAFAEEGGDSPAYAIGVYGSGAVCQRLLDRGLARYTWLAAGRRWRGTADFAASGRWHLRQHTPTHVCGVEVDPDDINPQMADIGAFNLFAEATDEPSAVATAGMPPLYPRHLLLENEAFDSPDVRLVQAQLNALGYGPLTVDGDFGPKTKAAIMLFQARHMDFEGNPLEVDGVIGRETWGALFGPTSLPLPPDDEVAAPTPLAARVLAIARSQVGIREQPPGSNRGPEVDAYVRAVGLDPTGRYAWCVAFLYWAFDEAVREVGGENPLPRTGGVHRLWQLSQDRAHTVVLPNQVTAARVQPGMLFCFDTGQGQGHAGLIVEVRRGTLTTIEGNTNNGGSREGVGVFHRTRRLHMPQLLGYLGFA